MPCSGSCKRSSEWPTRPISSSPAIKSKLTSNSARRSIVRAVHAQHGCPSGQVFPPWYARTMAAKHGRSRTCRHSGIARFLCGLQKFCVTSEHPMAPISKDTQVLTAPPETASAISAAPVPRHEDTATASRPQPVALEVPVTVNGARTVEGSDKREPFSEATKTVLVFGNGAVIRLGSPVSPGQLLFLTNEKTKKEVVCQVVKSKNYRSVSGYVELEFTESVVGFWGMRFPSDRIGAQTPAASTAV